MTKYSWEDIPTVVELSTYLKANKHHGFTIVLLDNEPTIHCRPGVTPAEKERWDVLDKAIGLLRAAQHDMRYLIANKMIKIPGHPGWR